MSDRCFIPFEELSGQVEIPSKFTYPFDYVPHPLAVKAAEDLQHYITSQQEWDHNFGLDEGKDGVMVGKMFGVLVVQTAKGQVGYLAGFSGKLAGGNHHAHFVPPVFDSLTENSFINLGMPLLTEYSNRIKALQEVDPIGNREAIEVLKEERKQHSWSMQIQLYDSYSFLNQYGEEKSLREIFKHNPNGNPPGGAGECAAPKLLQYAFQNKMKPLAIAEFWWGAHSRSNSLQHGAYYPSCLDKCMPILGHMLKGIEIDQKPNDHSSE